MTLTHKIYDDFSDKLAVASHEEEIRLAWASMIEQALNIRGVNAEEDKRDMSFDNVLIEFKDRGLFHGDTSSPKFKEATEGRILKYVIRWAKKLKKPQSYFIGIATDGIHMALCQVINGEIKSGNLMQITFENTEYILNAIKQNLRYPLTSETLIKLFGRNSSIGKNILNDLFLTLENDLNSQVRNKTQLFYEEWVNLYGQVADLSANNRSKLFNQFGFPEDSDTSHVLFAINTYNSLLVKSIAAELVSTTELASFSHFSESIFLTSDTKLYHRIEQELEKSTYFEDANIHNFVSEVLFSWYIYSQNKPLNMISDFKKLYEQLSLLNVTKHDAMLSGDVLKKFYENLVPDTFRKSLGEFYTPDWLVQYMVEQLSPIEDKSVLDPTCGSGSFLLEIIRDKINYFTKQNIPSAQQITNIEKQVVGFDLNPLAVQTARVNYLFAIIDLISKCPGIDVEVPILLADAVYAPELNDKTSSYKYTIGSEIANLTVDIPKVLVDSRKDLIRTFNKLNHHIDKGDSFDECLPELKASFSKYNNQFFKDLELTYNRVQQLHSKNWDGIWFQIISNFFWSIELPLFDIIIGNPPWVRWSTLPELYRKRVKKTAEEYGIFSEHKYHGGNELDISALVTYTVADRWLKADGTLSFLLPQNHLQNDSSSGFRQLKIKNQFLQPVHVEDLKNIKVFDDATNKPMIFTFNKQLSPLKYPVEYDLWTKVGNRKTVKSETPLKSILSNAEIAKFVAKPLHDNSRAPWIFGASNELKKFDKIIGDPTYKGHKGITTDLNGIYFPKIIQHNNGLVQIETRPEAGRKNIGPARKVWIESDILYPLVKGASNINSGYGFTNEGIGALIPNCGIKKADYLKAEHTLDNLPKTLSYFESFESLLRNRSTFKNYMHGAPYWAVYNVGKYTFSPYKVVWAEIGQSLKASLFTSQHGKVFIPDHKTYFVDFNDEDAAIFLMCLLNNPTLSHLVSNSTVSTSRGDILKHLHLPLYNKNNSEHLNLIHQFKSSSTVDWNSIHSLTDKILF